MAKRPKRKRASPLKRERNASRPPLPDGSAPSSDRTAVRSATLAIRPPRSSRPPVEGPTTGPETTTPREGGASFACESP